MKITHIKLAELLDEYIADACKPLSQMEPRFPECFDKKSIVDEIYLSISTIENIKTEENLRRLVRLFVQIAEENANSYKTVKITAVDIAFAREKLQEQLARVMIA